MNFQQLEYVLAVHHQKHFGKAAISCNVTQATLSGMIKRLEDEIGLILFERSKHPIQTTDQGQLFIKKVEEILELKQSLYQLSTPSKDLRGHLRLGVIPTIANTLLPLILPTFLKEHPNLQLDLIEITTEEIVEKLKTRKIDLGILSTPLPSEMEFPIEEILYYESMFVYGLESKSETVSIAELKEQRVWLLEEGHCFRNQSMSICNLEEQNENEAQLNFKSNSFDTLLNLSDQFGGYTLLPELYYQQLSEKRKAKCKSFNKPIPVREVSLVASTPLIKRQALTVLSETIRKLVPPKLLSTKYANKDLDIIAM